MNLAIIDAAIAAYRPRLDEADGARLAFFRELWAVQDAVSRESPNASYAAPPDAELRAWSGSGESIFGHVPAFVSADALADAASRLAAVLRERGGFADPVNESLARTRWDRLVAASPLALAGVDPADYVEEFVDLLSDDGMGEAAAHMGGVAVSLALRALLDPAAQAVVEARARACADAPRPVRCPACGAPAALARVGASTMGQGGTKDLWCAQCGCSWPFERVRCARCGTRNQGRLHYFNIEGDEAHRMAVCDECGGYVRTVYQESALAPFSWEVEDVVMARLDLVAYRRAVAGATVAEGASDDGPRG
ncbi:formate dehydrogenase [Gordonibacter sp. An230]|uniref:formate dehydrogenase accessory protein FdhE n=1 Tax=Gordonibacter sp. An230 TaxID=1965592 RepID=UPI000B37380F|nr:formate dehydrogenase accessory protein FdhE [Gordonibacter sp. An230]OUO86080.1 formate dehydrogenase [Gordonibacter sp. An230]